MLQIMNMAKKQTQKPLMYFNMSKKETIEVVVLEHDVILGSRYVVKEVEVEESEVKNEEE